MELSGHGQRDRIDLVFDRDLACKRPRGMLPPIGIVSDSSISRKDPLMNVILIVSDTLRYDCVGYHGVDPHRWDIRDRPRTHLPE